jgi:cathepsin B
MLVLLLAVLAAAQELNLNAPAINLQLIKEINDLTPGWKAGINTRFIGQNLAYAKRLCGVLPGGPKLPLKEIIPANDIPESFDPREKWPSCKSLFEIRDQGPCGSCWAISSVEVFTDRHCIDTGEVPELSTEDVLSCCSGCGMGCNGGWPSAAFDYWRSSGVVTGGGYKSEEGCYPYELMECEHHVPGPKPPCPSTQPTPPCRHKCINGLDWGKDKHFAKNVYGVSSREAEIQTELMTYGPLGATISVYEDFLTYKSGVYHHTSGRQVGGHAVKLFGWGVENGQKYWLVANSWNEDWGDKGFIKMLRGRDECGIESDLTGGHGKKHD